MTAAGVGITNGMMKIAGSTFETQDALAELKSLGITDLKAVEDAARQFSDTWAGTTKADFITAAYDIKSGIASPDGRRGGAVYGAGRPDGQGHQVHDRGDDLPVCDRVWHL